jgi:hypothetical protein
MTSDWEVFASMLVKDVGKKLASGIDLAGHEVKSAEKGGSFEYQYHKKGGKAKLKDDMEAGHLFFTHSNNLQLVELRYAHGRDLKNDFFERWLSNFPEPYPQRYRKSIPFGWVVKNGKLLMKLENGEITFPATASVPPAEARAKLQPSDEGEDE